MTGGRVAGGAIGHPEHTRRALPAGRRCRRMEGGDTLICLETMADVLSCRGDGGESTNDDACTWHFNHCWKYQN